MGIEDAFIESHIEDLGIGISALAKATTPNRILEVTYAISGVTRDFRFDGWAKNLSQEEKTPIEEAYKRVDQEIEKALKTYETVLKETASPPNFDSNFPTCYSLVEEYKKQIAERCQTMMQPRRIATFASLTP